jgi:hypothetical protein
MSFTLDIGRFCDKASGNADKVVRAAVTLAAQGVVLKSPVDTGRLRGSWVFGEGTPADSPAAIDKAGGATVGKISAAVSARRAGSVFYVTSNLPYARVIEYGGYPNPPKSGSKTVGGYSKQAPAGMVRVTFNELPAALLKYAATLK